MTNLWRGVRAALWAVSFSLVVTGVSVAETIELVTYYPSPGGGNVSTDRLHARRATIGDPYSLNNPAEPNPPNGTLLVAGRVGIGTNAPLMDLEVYREDESYVRIWGTGSNNPAVENFSGLELGSDLPANGVIDQIWQLAHKRQGGGGLNDFQISHRDALGNWTRPLTIQPGGNVGIGTPTPQTLLDATGVVAARHSINSMDYQAQMGTMTPNGAAGIGFWANLRSGTDNLASNSTTARGATILVNGYPAGVGSLIFSGNRASSAVGATFDPASPSNTIMTLQLGTGRVGIGTQSPETTLHIRAANPATDNTYLRISAPLANQSAISFADDTNGQDVVLYRGGNSRDFWIWTATGNNVDPSHVVMTVTQSGNVGIGTRNPSGRLTVQQASSGGAPEGLTIVDQNGNFRRIYMTNNDTTLAFINQFGNVATLTNAGGWLDASDLAYKKEIAPVRYGLREVLQLKPRQYRMKVDNSPQVGFVAQEVRELIPEVVGGQEPHLTLSYSHLLPVVVKAVQELKAENDDLRRHVKELEASAGKEATAR